MLWTGVWYTRNSGCRPRIGESAVMNTEMVEMSRWKMTLGEEKAALRARMRAVRDRLDERERHIASESICRHLLAHPWIRGRMDAGHEHGRTPALLAFCAIRSEPDMSAFVREAWKRGMRVLFPRVDRGASRLTLHAVNSEAELVPGAWGIPEPSAEAAEWDVRVPPDLVLVPGLAFDRSGGRLGYGRGFYDRLLAEWRAPTQGTSPLADPLLVAPAFEAMLVERVPCEPHDVKVDLIVTECGPVPVQNS